MEIKFVTRLHATWVGDRMRLQKFISFVELFFRLKFSVLNFVKCIIMTGSEYFFFLLSMFHSRTFLSMHKATFSENLTPSVAVTYFKKWLRVYYFPFAGNYPHIRKFALNHVIDFTTATFFVSFFFSIVTRKPYVELCRCPE